MFDRSCFTLGDDAPAVIKVAGWIPGCLLQAASHGGPGRVTRESDAGDVSHQDLPEGHVVFHGGPNEMRHSGPGTISSYLHLTLGDGWEPSACSDFPHFQKNGVAFDVGLDLQRWHLDCRMF